jgi:hypothetical protein
MRQKYLISRNFKRKELKITEYAVLDKDLKKVVSENLRKDNFSLIGQETYKSDVIINSISLGSAALVETLRTHNIFPISPYALKIAETIKELYTLSEDNTAELFFDDIDLIPAEQEVES